ncbi:alpha/beta hydrolase [Chamaesiphon minutus]|uniref:X-Pro dipeptidyl-peptidase (S15 family) n=1 Tax=Chamaesiphon minutus (strain ATCC 27169 / PCC 6605) TaxID=1173020 RepID=K9UPC5_CHAP6|nr:CocE/NonD family hydrolase [Chamaesiphon minutus]AFY96538.1 X-Pro dipeptidyl-peptidase (S15 family) [Chamaesiphon minutus PCC 6605]
MKLSSRLLAMSLVMFGSTAAVTNVFAQTVSSPQQKIASNRQTFKPGINRVTFQSAGEKLVGNLYLPTNYKTGDKLPTVIVSGSWTTVKEQMAGKYAQKLAERGYAALAFDSRSFGESGGKLRSCESPTVKIQDIKNAISFLQTVDAVDKNRIAGLGICAGAGYMTTVAAEDDRLKSLITVALWLHNPAIVNQVYGGKAKVQQMIQTGRKAAASFAKTGKGDYLLATSKTDKTAVMFGDIDYYQNPQRGAIPQWNNRFAVATWAEWLTFNPMDKADRVKIPTLFIHSEKGAIPAGAKQFFATIPTTNKKIVWMNDYQQFDFYDRPDVMEKTLASIVDRLRSTL